MSSLPRPLLRLSGPLLHAVPRRSLSLLLNRKPVVSELQLHGMIMAGNNGMGVRSKNNMNIENLEKSIAKAFKPKRLDAVLLNVNSGGGSATQSELIADLIRMKAAETKIPVYSFVEDIAASGGYWLACAGEKIYVSQCSIVGSIGVISSSFGFQRVIERWGVERRVRTAGKNKSMMDPFVEEKEHDKMVMDRTLKAVHKIFKGRMIV